MNDKEIFELMKLVETGDISAAQAQKIIETLRGTSKTNPGDSDNWFQWNTLSGIGDWFYQRVSSVVQGIQKPEATTLVVHVVSTQDGAEVSRFQIPIKVFLLLKNLLTWLPSTGIAKEIDFEALYKEAEAGKTGVIFEKTVEEKEEKITVIIE